MSSHSVPLVPGPARLHVDEGEVAFQLLAVQAKLQVALGEHLARVALRLPCADVPDHDCARAIVARRNDALEVEVRNRMIFHLHGEALVGGIERRTFGHGPGFQYAFHLKAEVVMQAGSAVLLHHEAAPLALAQLGRRLGRLLEVAFPFVFLERHTNFG